ncbi:hypothetical protein F5887DRAFT_1069969 [Amanita rubescens]|nr:hypothetical protein F5887DRAFT_1069969 [Amanita rubescens]
MSALSFARQAFGFEKPHSSVTDWIDILTSNKISEEAYEGIPELVDAITLQASGPAEAARALRKKLKHGQPHQQYRALIILGALVENAGPKFHAAFSDDQIVDAFKQLSSDPQTDTKVKKKLLLMLASWRNQYQNDPSMSMFAGLYGQCRGVSRMQSPPAEASTVSNDTSKEEKKKAKQKQERERRNKEAEEARRKKTAKAGRVPFNLERERPNVLSTIAGTSQASSNLTNAIMLVNTQSESIRDNERVQECLENAKQARKSVVRYIQLVEDEDLIGALIETNERIVAAIQLYEDSVEETEGPQDVTKEITRGLAATQIGSNDHESHEEIVSSQGERAHPDLQDLSFGPLGSSSSKLPAPIEPSKLLDNYFDASRISLSDFSDYEPGEEAHDAEEYSPPRQHSYNDVTANKTRHLPDSQEDDPFADPFADERAI